MREEYVKKNEQMDRVMKTVLQLTRQIKTADAAGLKRQDTATAAGKKRQDTITSQSEEEK